MRLPGRYDGVARPIVTYGSNPVLHRPCAPVTTFDGALRRLVLDMFASMTEAERTGSFHHKKVGARAAIVAAGPIANFILAIVIFTFFVISFAILTTIGMFFRGPGFNFVYPWETGPIFFEL
mgnify:CR=1 FL=1